MVYLQKKYLLSKIENFGKLNFSEEVKSILLNDSFDPFEHLYLHQPVRQCGYILPCNWWSGVRQKYDLYSTVKITIM
jgi:hypothetical protein